MNIFVELAKRYGNQSKAADKLGVSTQLYNAWYSGKRKPSISNMKKIAKICNLSMKKIRPDIFDK